MYIDGFVLPVPKRNLKAYAKLSALSGKIWREYGALDYKECVGDDLKVSFGLPFTELAKTKPGETVLFSFIVYKSRAHRDAVNKRVMKDPRLGAFCDMDNMPFDVKRMALGGFRVLVQG